MKAEVSSGTNQPSDLSSVPHEAEEVLLKKRALQSAIFNSANFSSIATDAKGIIQIFNVAAERMLGYTAAEMMNKIMPAELHDPQDGIARAEALSVEFGTPIAPGFDALVFKAARGMEDVYELTNVRKDGSRFPAVVSVTELRDAEAAIIGYLFLGTDNTARKQTEEALVKAALAAAELAAIQGAISGAAIIAVTDLTGKIEQVNDNFVNISKYSREELIGQDHRLLNSGVHPKEFIRHLWLTIAKGEVWRNDIRNRAKDGSLYWVDTTIAPVLNERGEPVKFIAVRFDITARMQAEEALLNTGALQSAIFNSANFSSIATDAKGVIQIFNVGAERMLGYTAAEVMNKITPADISDPQELIARATALSVELETTITPGFEALVFKASRGIEDIYELTYIRKDGSRFPAVVSVTALRDAQDVIIGYLLIGTELKAGALQSAIFNSANFSSIATDAKGVIQIFNVGAERMLGYTAAEVMNKITPADISDPQELIARATALSVELGTTITPGFEALVFKASRGIEDIYELTYIRKDGSRFPAVVSVTALRDAQDAIIGYLLIGTDNSARKQVEEERMKLDQRLRDQQFYTRSLIESNIDALMTTDPLGIITDVNKQMEALTGCTRDELIGAPFKNYFTDPERAEAGIKLVLSEKKVTDYELTARARDGKETVVSYNATTFYDRDRKLQGVFAAARDVTERKQAEQELSERARLLDLSNDAIIVRDLDDKITLWNKGAEKLYGWTCEEVIGKHLDSLLQLEFPKPMEEILAQLHSEGEFSGEVVQIARDGRRMRSLCRWVLDRGTKSILTSYTDITERRMLEDSLAARASDLVRADRSKDEFLAMLAHELRNPLAPLRNAAEILQTTGASADEHGQAQRIIGRQIENMTRMIDDLLDVSRITEGKIELCRQPAALADILAAAASVVRSGIAARRQELTISLPAEPIFLNADATRLDQVFGNLLGNACKYSDSGCHISLSAERAAGVEPPEVIVRVRDDGMGIAPELLPHIFGLFVQSTRSLDRAHGGLGIGLTLVQRLVKLHGGSVEARSEGTGHGSEFIVRLPILPGPAAVRPPPAPAPPDTPRRILIVDDNEDATSSMAILQRRRGHATRVAFTGPEAVAAAAEFLPEVVLLDIGLPGMDGFEVARRLRAMPALAGVFLVAMTGYSSDGDRARAREAGFDEYLVKPVDLDLLREWLRSRA